MSYQQQPDPSILQAIAAWLRDQALPPGRQTSVPIRPRGGGSGYDQGQAQAEEGYARDAAAAQQQYGMFNDGSPNALQGGVVEPPHPFASQVVDTLTGQGYPEDYLSWGPRGTQPSQQVAAERAESAGLPGSAIAGPGQEYYGGPNLAPGPANYNMPPAEDPAKTPSKKGAKSKSEFGDFFKLLKKAKSGDENTKSKISELAKQLDDEELSASGGTVPVA